MTPGRDAGPPLTLGTAGHIDHGKTALIIALTGINTDRLPEERSRGISIELGYAPLDLPSGRRLSVVDVPGHERFVRTMVAGASGIDMFLLCIAADDGVMPQTREHLAVLRQLGVAEGVVAITKADIGEPGLASEEAAELVPGVRIVPVSAVAGIGLDELRAALDEVASRLPGRAGDDGPVRLHVDRSFTLRGIGTVVTGTLWSGAVREGETVRVLPRGLEARVRSVQVHDQPVEAAEAGQRVALNLAGVAWRELRRGDVVTTPGAELRPGYLLDVRVELEAHARPLRRGARIHVHHGTREAPARVVPLEGDDLRPGAPALVQLRLEAPLMAAPGDRVILRQVAPPDTIGPTWWSACGRSSAGSRSRCRRRGRSLWRVKLRSRPRSSTTTPCGWPPCFGPTGRRRAPTRTWPRPPAWSCAPPRRGCGVWNRRVRPCGWHATSTSIPSHSPSSRRGWWRSASGTGRPPSRGSGTSWAAPGRSPRPSSSTS
ncbi:MAG: selenocysteine-specific translation elongation factor, partial [Actinobacteria bacterium]